MIPRCTIKEPRRRNTETGAATLTVLMVLALLGALSLTLAAVTTNNMASARLAQQAGSALNAADAGIAQALVYLRQEGVGSINACQPKCSGNRWGNSKNPVSVFIDGRSGQEYEVWIEQRRAFPNTEFRPGVYRIHSTGVAAGSAERKVTVDVQVSSGDFPLALVANSMKGGGNTTATGISLFTTGCIYERDLIKFEGLDAAYGIPAAAHSSSVITTGNNCLSSSIHPPACRLNQEGIRVDEVFQFDQDSRGAPLEGTDCYDSARTKFANPYQPQFDDPNHLAYKYPRTSLMVAEDLFRTFGIRRPPLTQARLDTLRAVARSQGNYWTTATSCKNDKAKVPPQCWNVPTARHSVVYFDLAATDPGGKVDLNDFIPTWDRPPQLEADDPECDGRSLTIVIEGGDAKMNANTQLAASVLLISDTHGNLSRGSGKATLTGPVYANDLDLTGNSATGLDECFLAHLPPTLTTLSPYNYREVEDEDG